MLATVIVPSFNSSQTIEHCLASVEDQTLRGCVEIIVVDSSFDGTDRIIASQFPGVQLFHFSDRKLPGEARNYAAAHASGDILIFLDADCTVEPTWLERVIKAHDGAYAAVGGAVCNGNPEDKAGWAHYLFEFSLWLPGAAAHEQREIPGGCLSIKKPVFLLYGPFPEGIYSEDTAFSWRLRSAGLTLLFDPEIRVFHRHTIPFSKLLRVKGYHGRCFAWQRAREWPAHKRILFGLLAGLLSPVLVFRVWRRVSHSPYLQKFWAVWYLIALLAICWSWGEVRGYLLRRKPLASDAGGSGRLGE